MNSYRPPYEPTWRSTPAAHTRDDWPPNGQNHGWAASASHGTEWHRLPNRQPGRPMRLAKRSLDRDQVRPAVALEHVDTTDLHAGDTLTTVASAAAAIAHGGRE